MLTICSSILERQPEHVNAGSGQNLLGRISKVTREAESQIQVQVRPKIQNTVTIAIKIIVHLVRRKTAFATISSLLWSMFAKTSLIFFVLKHLGLAPYFDSAKKR
jgi:hypothetical protein